MLLLNCKANQNRKGLHLPLLLEEARGNKYTIFTLSPSEAEAGGLPQLSWLDHVRVLIIATSMTLEVLGNLACTPGIL